MIQYDSTYVAIYFELQKNYMKNSMHFQRIFDIEIWLKFHVDIFFQPNSLVNRIQNIVLKVMGRTDM